MVHLSNFKNVPNNPNRRVSLLVPYSGKELDVRNVRFIPHRQVLILDLLHGDERR